jgi:hypothetical protein
MISPSEIIISLVSLVLSALNRCTVQPFTESDVSRCCVNKIGPPEDGHVNAGNMSRIVVFFLLYRFIALSCTNVYMNFCHKNCSGHQFT